MHDLESGTEEKSVLLSNQRASVGTKNAKDDYYSIGQEIINVVKNGPRSCRMGDIYHKIRETVEKMKKYKIAPERRGMRPRQNENRSFKQLMKDRKSSDSDDSFKSIEKDERLQDLAEKLRELYKKDPTKSIDKGVIYREQ